MQHATVTVCKDLSYSITIMYKGRKLNYTCHKRGTRIPEIVDAKQLGAKLDTIKASIKRHKPRADHPWRRYIINPAKITSNEIHRFSDRNVS